MFIRWWIFCFLNHFLITKIICFFSSVGNYGRWTNKYSQQEKEEKDEEEEEAKRKQKTSHDRNILVLD